MKKYRIAQIGSFDVENYGDLLFAEVFEKKIKKYIQVEEIILFAPKKCKMPFYENRQVWSVTELEKMNLEKCKEIVLLHPSAFLINKELVKQEFERKFKIKTYFAKEK